MSSFFGLFSIVCVCVCVFSNVPYKYYKRPCFPEDTILASRSANTELLLASNMLLSENEVCISTFCLLYFLNVDRFNLNKLIFLTFNLELSSG